MQRKLYFLLFTVAHVSVSTSTAAGALEKPIIELTSPSGGLVWVSGHAEITKGYSFIFNCSFNSNNSPGPFILKFSSQGTSKNQTSQSNSFNFYAAEHDHEGNYSCVYTGDRNNTSPESDPIYVVIKYPLLNLLIYSVVPGATLLLLVVVLIVVLVCRRIRRDRRPEGVILTQTAAAIRNSHNDEEEEEQDYVDVDPRDNNRKSNPVANEEDEEENDYESPEGEDDNDYENLEDEEDNDHESPEDEDDNDYENLEDEEDNDHESPEDEDDNDYENLEDEDDNDYESPEDEGDNVKGTKAAVTAMKQREEDWDEDDSSGDEHDYVNLAESISEQTLH